MSHRALVPSLVGLLAALVPSVSALDLPGFQGLPDIRPEVRRSLGIRSATPRGNTTIQVVIGASATSAAGSVESWQIISEDDPAYAYDRFVRPTAARAHTEQEIPAHGDLQGFQVTRVTLELPEPMQPGKVYHVVGQGDPATGMMVTGARTAASLTTAGPIDANTPDVDAAVIGLRQVDPVGPHLLRMEFGPGFNTAQCANPAYYRISIAGKPATVVGIGRNSRLDTYVPIGWPYQALSMHEVFVKVDQTWTNGDSIEVKVHDELTLGGRTARLTYQDTSTITRSIKTNQVGYRADGVKMAYLGRWMGSYPETLIGSQASGAGTADFWRAVHAAGHGSESAPTATTDVSASSPALFYKQSPEFLVYDDASHAVAWRGTARLVHMSGTLNEGPQNMDHSGENVYQLDLTEFRKPGRYYISVPGTGRSLPFTIDDAVYQQAFAVQSYGLLIQRAGLELKPPYSAWRRIAGHTAGVIPTTASRLDPFDWTKFPEQIDRSGQATVVYPDALRALDRDQALVARWTLDRDGSDASGKGNNLTTFGEWRHIPEKGTLPSDDNACLAATDGDQNGGSAPQLTVDAAQGITMCGWFRQSAEVNQWDGVLMGFANAEENRKLAIRVGWGSMVLVAGEGGELALGRLPDMKWHHLAVVVSRLDQTHHRITCYDNGKTTGVLNATGDLLTAGFDLFRVRGTTGSKYIDDVRIYNRCLNADELQTISTIYGNRNLAIQADGGHYDAGDYEPRSHIDVAQALMDAYELKPSNYPDGQMRIPESGNGTPDIVDEAMWSLEVWKGLQDADGGVRNGIESNGDENFIGTIDRCTLKDYAFAKDAAGSYVFAGAFAQASRIWTSLGQAAKANDYLQRAKRAWTWAEAHPPQKAVGAAEMAAKLMDPKAYAAAQLLHTTGDHVYQEAFMAAAVWSQRPDAPLDIYQLYDQTRAAWAYVACPRSVVDVKVQDAVKAAIIRWADELVQNAQTMAYGFIRHPYAPISWGTGAYQHWVQSVIRAHALTKDDRYLAWIIRTCDNTLGANPMGISYIVGLGARTVRAPLHNSRFNPTGEVMRGVQVEGPVQYAPGYQVKSTFYPDIRENFANLYTYVDAHFAIDMNEPLVSNMVETLATFGYLLQPATLPPAK